MESSSSRRPLPINHWNVSNALTTSGWSSGRAHFLLVRQARDVDMSWRGHIQRGVESSINSRCC